MFFNFMRNIFLLIEMGYTVRKIQLYSMDDNKTYPIALPKDNIKMFEKFERLLLEINSFNFDDFTQTNITKCLNCIYEPYCDRSMLE